MHTKFVIFVFISTFLIAGIYSSSVSVAYANIICGYTGDGQTKFCTDTLHEHFYRCDQDDEGKWNCHRASTVLSNNLPPSLNKALDAAIGESKNTTKVPKSDLLNDGGLLQGQGNNQTTSQRITGPNDRFCIEGTGGDTGTPCLPCDPGLKFVVGCIDVTTGGPLDMPDAATSEPGKSNDTNPKDLGGLNNDENSPQLNPGSD